MYRGPNKVRAQQRRHASTHKKADPVDSKSSSASKGSAAQPVEAGTRQEVSTDEVIRQTQEAIAKLKESRGSNRPQAIEEAFEAAKRQAETEPAFNLTKLRTPILFGAGLYLGLVLFGNHRDEKQGSQFLAELKASFNAGGTKGGGDDGDDGGVKNDAIERADGTDKIAPQSGSSEYDKWRASREGQEQR